MLMGQRPGKMFHRMMALKVNGPEALSPPARVWAEANALEFLTAPKQWTGEYVDAYENFVRENTPKS
jgi:hypothetical protein